MYNVDIEKIIALRKAGWGPKRIAAEMHMEPDAVDKTIAEYKDKEKKKVDERPDGVSEKKVKEVPIISVTLEQMKEICDRAAAIWYSVKKKYKLNVNFFHNILLSCN